MAAGFYGVSREGSIDQRANAVRELGGSCLNFLDTDPKSHRITSIAFY